MHITMHTKLMPASRPARICALVTLAASASVLTLSACEAQHATPNAGSNKRMIYSAGGQAYPRAGTASIRRRDR
jgi:hypothetical protein